MTITPSQPLAHPIWEDSDVFEVLLTPLLGSKDLLHLRGTCHLLKKRFGKDFQEIRTRLFTERYGTRAECEKHITLEAQIEKIKRVSALNKQLENTLDPWLVFDQEGNPQIVEYNEHFPGKLTSIFELLKAKYQFYRCGSVGDRDDQLQRLFDFQNTVISDFDQKPLDPSHPIQDLRNRYRRVGKINKERAILQSALKKSTGSFFNNLSLIEKVLFFVISFFHSFFQKASNSRIDASSLAFKRLSAHEIQLAEETLEHNRERIKVKITAQLNYSNGKLADAMRVCIENKDSDMMLGSFDIRREWTTGDHHYFSEDDFDSKKTMGQLRDPRLHILLLDDHLGQDPITGDEPILRLIIQVAVEIFKRQPETKLVMTWYQGHSDVFVAGGFTPPAKPALREILLLNDPLHPIPQLPIIYKKEIYLRWIQDARNQGQVFPPRREIGAFDVQLEKHSVFEDTQFGTTDENNQIQPSYVNFTLNAAPIPWEQQIEHLWLLPPSKNPVLPDFFTRKLDRFEKALPIMSLSEKI